MPKPLVERALELADSGLCASVRDIRTQLKVEQYANIAWALQGLGLRRQLKAIIAARRAEACRPGPETQAASRRTA